MIRRILPCLLLGMAPLGWCPPASARDLTLEERVALQTQVERARYAHQIGATLPFEAAVPREVIERKVRRALEESAALETLWRTPVTSEMLNAEMDRMVAGTRMPERLREIFGSLGNDSLAIQEALARPLLVDRLARSFYAADARLHEGARAEARSLETALRRDGVEAFANDARRAEVTLSPEELALERGRAPAAVGAIGPVEDLPDAFVIRVVLAES